MINKFTSLICTVCKDFKILSLFTVVNNVVSAIVGAAMVAAVDCDFARQTKAVAGATQFKSIKADLT